MIRARTDEHLNALDAEEWLHRASRGDLAGAWVVSDRIRARTGSRRDWSAPRRLQAVWDGADFAGRRVLIRCYHGLGDTIQFIRYAPLLKAVAREVIVWVQPALLPLLRSAQGIDRLLPLHDGTPNAGYDVDIEVMELPYAFRSTLSTIPRDVPYLTAAAAALDAPRPRIGIVWRAGDWDRRRSIPFPVVSTLFDVPGVSWYALQMEIAREERLPRLLIPDTRGIERLAEAIRGLDLVVTIDSMPAHLAGALGVPVWTLLPHAADWRWMVGRADSPWYPTMRLFRQSQAGEWGRVIEEIRHLVSGLGPQRR